MCQDRHEEQEHQALGGCGRYRPDGSLLRAPMSPAGKGRGGGDVQIVRVARVVASKHRPLPDRPRSCSTPARRRRGRGAAFGVGALKVGEAMDHALRRVELGSDDVEVVPVARVVASKHRREPDHPRSYSTPTRRHPDRGGTFGFGRIAAGGGRTRGVPPGEPRVQLSQPRRDYRNIPRLVKVLRSTLRAARGRDPAGSVRPLVRKGRLGLLDHLHRLHPTTIQRGTFAAGTPGRGVRPP